MRLTKEQVLRLHEMLASETGGSAGVRDEGLLESALESAYAGFGDTEFYPSVTEKGARLGYSLISDHAFIDGNKRIGMLTMLVFLELNGVTLQCTDEDVIRAGLDTAAGSMDYDALLRWVSDRRT